MQEKDVHSYLILSTQECNSDAMEPPLVTEEGGRANKNQGSESLPDEGTGSH